MYNTALEASYDRALNDTWARSGLLIARLLADAGPEALEGDGRAGFVVRAFTMLRPVMEDTLSKTRAHSFRQLGYMGLPPGQPDLAALALTELDVHNMMSAAARYFFATGNKKDYAEPSIKAEAFRHAVQLMSKSVITTLSDRRVEAATRSYAAGGVRLFERHLGSGDHCDRCKAIAGAIVTRTDVKPIHDKCTCGVRPVAPRHR